MNIDYLIEVSNQYGLSLALILSLSEGVTTAGLIDKVKAYKEAGW